MRRRAVSTQELSRLRQGLAEDYDLRDYEVDAGPKVLRVTGPDIAKSALERAKARAIEARYQGTDILAGRDDLAPSPESAARGEANWMELWPCSRAMATYFGHSVRMRSVDAVEVNCGLGTAGLGAAAKGARVTLADSNPEALRFARYNALQNGFTHVRTLEFDWKNDRFTSHVGSIIMADVLFEQDNFDHVFRLLRDNLAPGRTAFLAEPGRPIASAFFEALRKTDYRVRLDMERVEDSYSDNYYLVSVLRIKKDR
jgi:predicted nicotinamide N-methyase